jgi:hypothetical protein
MTNGFWETKPSFNTLELLLKNGAKGEAVNKALMLAITEINIEALAEPFLDLLLHWNADVNYNSGRVLQVAATQGNIKILPRLFTRNPTVDSSLMAFPYLFISGVNEEGMLSPVGLLFFRHNEPDVYLETRRKSLEQKGWESYNEIPATSRYGSVPFHQAINTIAV